MLVFSHLSGGLGSTLKIILDAGGVPFLQGTRQSLYTIVQVAAMAADFKDGLSALDLNPLMVLPEGQGGMTADVLMEWDPVAEQNKF